MGRLKQLLPLGRSSILENAIANLLRSQVDEVLVVLGYQAETIKPGLLQLPLKIIINLEFKVGMSSSIKAGLEAIQPEADAVMLVLGDQPFIKSRTINKLLKEYKSHFKGIAVPVYDGCRGHPVIFSTSYRHELMALQGDIGARSLINRHGEDVLEVKVNSPAVCIDIDDPEMYNEHKHYSR